MGNVNAFLVVTIFGRRLSAVRSAEWSQKKWPEMQPMLSQRIQDRRGRQLLLTFLAVAVTVAAACAAWYWALAVVLTSFDVLSSAPLTDTDIIKRLWHFRLVRPEWVGHPPEYVHWVIAETITRLAAIVVFFAGWGA